MTEIISLIALLLLIMDPIGNLPIFMTILKSYDSKQRKIVLIREMLIALGIMLFFLFFGEKILTFLNLRTEAISISGGIILFLIAVKMIFPSSTGNSIGLSEGEEPFLVPLATPLVSGPSLLSTLILLSNQYSDRIGYLVSALLCAWSVTVSILLLSDFFLKLLGNKGINVLERLMGLILVMLATQMLLDCIQNINVSSCK